MDSRHPGGLLRAIAIVAVIGALIGARTAQAQVPSGSTLSPDKQSYLVNKDLGNERWTINVNLFSSNPSDIINVTGSIFRADGGPASFVTCLVRATRPAASRIPTASSGSRAAAATPARRRRSRARATRGRRSPTTSRSRRASSCRRAVPARCGSRASAATSSVTR